VIFKVLYIHNLHNTG